MAKEKTKSEESQPDPLVLNLRSFTSPERLECQIHFDAPFGDLARALFEAIDPERTGASEIRIEGSNGRFFPDQIAQYLLWVQARRDDPDVELEDFDDLSYGQLNGAYHRGLVGKGSTSTSRKSSSPDSGSADSSPD